MRERREWHLTIATFKAMYNKQWPEHLKIHFYKPKKPGLRSETKFLIDPGTHRESFINMSAKLFNSLPLSLRSETNFKTFYNGTKKLFLERARNRVEGLGNI